MRTIEPHLFRIQRKKIVLLRFGSDLEDKKSMMFDFSKRRIVPPHNYRTMVRLQSRHISLDTELRGWLATLNTRFDL